MSRNHRHLRRARRQDPSSEHFNFAGLPLRMPTGPLQRSTAPQTDADLEREADQIADSAAPTLTAGVASGAASERRSPAPLQTPTASGSRLGWDFSQVRIHTDERAAASARALNARAYTQGEHIVFGAGQFQPESKEGRRLLAHELAHVAQQQSIGPRIQRKPLYDDTAWSARVTAVKSNADRLKLLTLAAAADRAKYPDLVLPVEEIPADRNDCVERHVYYDPNQTDPGVLHKLSMRVTHLLSKDTFEDYPKNEKVPLESEAPACVVLGPSALSPHNKDFTGAVVYHEYVHLGQHLGRQHREILDDAASKSPVNYVSAKEALAHAETFNAYFGRLHYDDKNAYDSVPGGRAPHEGISSLATIEGHYWASLYSLPNVKSKVIELIVSAAPDKTKKAQLRSLVEQLRGGNVVGAPNDFRKRVLEAL